VQLLVKAKTLVRVDTLVFHAVVLEGLKAEIRARKRPRPTAGDRGREDLQGHLQRHA
jgi:hypothetical protein